MVAITKKDITTVDQGVLLNGVNCQNVMGSGVARAYFEKWPEVKQQYHVWDDSFHVLGKFDPVIIEHDRLYVANCWTQEHYGSDGQVYADPGAILASASQAMLFARRKNLDVYTPWIGCGLGGLEQSVVLNLLEYLENILNVGITVCEI